MGILAGLTAAICWGAADFLARSATLKVGTFRTLFYMQFVGLFFLTSFLFISGEFSRLSSSASAGDWAWAILSGILNSLSSLALYRSFEIGLISIVSPIAAGYGAVTVFFLCYRGR